MHIVVTGRASSVGQIVGVEPSPAPPRGAARVGRCAGRARPPVRDRRRVAFRSIQIIHHEHHIPTANRRALRHRGPPGPDSHCDSAPPLRPEAEPLRLPGAGRAEFLRPCSRKCYSGSRAILSISPRGRAGEPNQRSSESVTQGAGRGAATRPTARAPSLPAQAAPRPDRCPEQCGARGGVWAIEKHFRQKSVRDCDRASLSITNDCT